MRLNPLLLLSLTLTHTLAIAACGPDRRSGGGGGGGVVPNDGEGEGAAEGEGEDPGEGEGEGPAEGEGEGPAEGEGEGEGEGGRWIGPGYDCSDKIFPGADISDIRESYSPRDWREAALDTLDARFPDGAWVARSLDSPGDFDRWFDGSTGSWDRMVGSLDLGVHEGTHMLGFQDMGFGTYTYNLGEGEVMQIQGIDTFFRREVYELLPQDVKDMLYADLYLRQIGDQDVKTLLDEFNAYTFSLYVSTALVDQFGTGSRSSARDGILSFMFFVEVYFRIARTEHPRDYEQMTSNDGFVELVLTLWDRAQCALDLAGDDPRLGIDDVKVRPLVHDEEWLSEIRRFADL